MSRRMVRMVFVALILSCPVTTGAFADQVAEDTPPQASGAATGEEEEASSVEAACFDVAVIATAPRYKWMPVKDDGVSIIMRSPVRITFDVEETISGDVHADTVTVETSLHTTMTRKNKTFLLYLQRGKSGRYRFAGMNWGVVQAGDGQYVLPMARPLDPSAIDVDGFFPVGYEKMLKPVRYRAKDAWWYGPDEVDHDDSGRPIAAAYPWGVAKDGWIVALRGLWVKDAVKALSHRRCRRA